MLIIVSVLAESLQTRCEKGLRLGFKVYGLRPIGFGGVKVYGGSGFRVYKAYLGGFGSQGGWCISLSSAGKGAGANENS